jgi:hypothetical protein
MAYKFVTKKPTDCNYIGGILLSSVSSAEAIPGAHKFEDDGEVENVLTRRLITRHRPLLTGNRKALHTT